MSAKVNLGVTLGSLTLLVIIGVVVITGSKANEEAALQAKINSEEAKKQSVQNNKDLDKQHKALQDFIDRWQQRVNISNKVQNSTQDKIEHATYNILGNLTDHRHITNATYELQVEQEKQLIDLQNKTNTLIKSFNATNEEERGKAVQNIIDQLHKDHIVLFKALNITSTDNETDAETDIDKIKQILKALEKDKPIPPGLAKK